MFHHWTKENHKKVRNNLVIPSTLHCLDSFFRCFSETFFPQHASRVFRLELQRSRKCAEKAIRSLNWISINFNLSIRSHPCADGLPHIEHSQTHSLVRILYTFCFVIRFPSLFVSLTRIKQQYTAANNIQLIVKLFN